MEDGVISYKGDIYTNNIREMLGSDLWTPYLGNPLTFNEQNKSVARYTQEVKSGWDVDCLYVVAFVGIDLLSGCL
ncbi:hypothetical protein [Prevotella sp. S7 MS 2]|uniref:hypothetical protein n=1 Tax=Prevotella sp. S7 MS 2 TaxID=1287488 RepID=UPI00051470FE|nr:hypothetical protein [Prevotella sp. S7 MS 2]KGI59786.1 hypothetical protein HMPREF0671_09685 [Prevotella sp. S7 MS 2]